MIYLYDKWGNISALPCADMDEAKAWCKELSTPGHIIYPVIRL